MKKIQDVYKSILRHAKKRPAEGVESTTYQLPNDG